MWLCLFIVVSSSCVVFISGNENGVPQGSVLKTNEQSVQDGARAANTTNTFEIQRRNLRLYPEWFSQRIKKIAGKRFTNSNFFPQIHRAAVREDVPTPNYRRSNVYGITSHSPIIVSDDIGDANNAPQSIPPGAELVDLPGSFQSLAPDDFHRLSYAHGKFCIFCCCFSRYSLLKTFNLAKYLARCQEKSPVLCLLILKHHPC